MAQCDPATAGLLTFLTAIVLKLSGKVRMKEKNRTLMSQLLREKRYILKKMNENVFQIFHC